MGSVSSRALRAVAAFCVLSICTACLGPNHATGRLGQFNGKQYAVAVSASTLVIYVNPKLVAQVGGSMDKFPTDFDIAKCR